MCSVFALFLMKYFPSRRLWTYHVVLIAKSQRQAGLANNLHITTTTLANTAKMAPSTSRSLPAMTSLSIGSQGTNVLVGTRDFIPKDLTALCSWSSTAVATSRTRRTMLIWDVVESYVLGLMILWCISYESFLWHLILCLRLLFAIICRT